MNRTGNLKSARSVYNRIIKAKNSTAEMKIQAWKRIKTSYKNQRNKKKYIEKIKEMGLFLKRKMKEDPRKRLYEKLGGTMKLCTLVPFGRLIIEKKLLKYTKSST